MIFEFPTHIRSSFIGYSILVDLFHLTRRLHNDHLILIFKNTVWFEANLCAGLGAILTKVESQNNTIEFKGHTNIQSILSKNGFLAKFGGWKKKDYYETTIQYRQFAANDVKLFSKYLEEELLAKPDLPAMSGLLKKKINESIFEIFNNCYLHGNCHSAFSCGQYYPNKKRLDFTIADLGHSIRKNVREYRDTPYLPGVEAIQWAVELGNTTRVGDTPGGLGYGIIREFIGLNLGKVQVVSSDGYWEEKKGHQTSRSFSRTFVGTLVNMEFNINDSSTYSLSSELTPKSIF